MEKIGYKFFKNAENSKMLKLLPIIKDEIRDILKKKDPELIKEVDEKMKNIILDAIESITDVDKLVKQMVVYYVAILSSNTDLYCYLIENGIPREYFLRYPYLIWDQATNKFSDNEEYLFLLKRFHVDGAIYILFHEGVDIEAVKKLLIERDFEKEFPPIIFNFLDSELIDILGADFILRLSEYGYENLDSLIKEFGRKNFNQYKEDDKEQLRPLLLKFKDVYTKNPDILFEAPRDDDFKYLLNSYDADKIIELAEQHYYLPMSYAKAAELNAIDTLDQLIDLGFNYNGFECYMFSVFTDILLIFKETNFFDRDPNIFRDFSSYGDWVNIVYYYKIDGLESIQNRLDIASMGHVKALGSRLKRTIFGGKNK